MTPDWQFWMNWIVSVVIAIGTIGAVIFALFGGWFRQRVTPPQLIAKLINERGVKVAPTVLTFPDGHTEPTVSRWYHIRLENRRRWSRATQAHVFLTNVEEPNAAGEFVSLWSGAIPLKIRYEGIVLTGRTVGPPIEYDLCSVFRVVGGAILQLHTVVQPANVQIQRDKPCNLRLTLQARSLEIDSKPIQVQVIWDGLWSDDTDQMINHMIIRQL